jgi:hypothetical protein
MIANGAIVPADLSTGGPNWDAGGNLTATSFVGPLSGNATTATTATTATNIASGVAGAVPYQTAPSTTGFTAAGTSGQVLRSNGTSAPTWSTNIAGNAGTATQLQTSRTLGISGDVTGTASFDGSANATIAGTIANNAVTSAKLGATERLQLAKAWVSFAISGSTATIYQSFNVSSITRNLSGDYTVNFVTTSPFSGTNYCAVASFGGGSGALFSMNAPNTNGVSTSAFRFQSGNISNTPTLQDAPYVSIAFFGN